MNLSYRHSNVMRNAVVAANGASVQVNTHSAAKKYNAPAELVPDIARSVAPAPKISSGMASGRTMSESSTLPRFHPTVRPAPLAPHQRKDKVPNVKLNIMVKNASVGMPSAVPTTGDTKTSAAPLTNQCAKVFATTITVRSWPQSASCSKVPSSASLLNSESSDSSDDNSAATQNHPRQYLPQKQKLKIQPQREQCSYDQKKHQWLQQLIGTAETETQFTAYDQRKGLEEADAHGPSSRRRRSTSTSRVWCATTSAAPPARTCDCSNSPVNAVPAVSKLVKGSSSSQSVACIARILAKATRRRCPADSTRAGKSAQAPTPVLSKLARNSPAVTRRLSPTAKRRFSNAVKSPLSAGSCEA